MALRAPDHEIADAVVTINRYRYDPIAFVREVIGDEPDAWQLEALRDYAEQDRISIRSGHGVGKSKFLSWIIIHFLCTRWPAKVPITGSNYDQLKATLWAEVASTMRQLPPQWSDEWEVTTEGMRLKAAPADSFAILRTASKDKAHNLAGFHAENIMVVVDEASAVDDLIFETLTGALTTEGAKLVLTGNPVFASGYFYETFNRRRELFVTRRVNCEDVDRVPRSWIREQAIAWGEDSNVYRIRVLGEFPTQDADGVIPLELIETAIGRQVAVLDEAPIWGLDVARYGDDRSALAKRQANHLMEPVRSWQGLDTEQLAGLVHREWLETSKPLKPARICVDVIGLGAGVYDKLRHQGLPVVAVNVAEAPASGGTKYERLRDELWFRARDWFSARDCSMPPDQELVAELAAPKYDVRASGKLKVESKDDMKARGRRSPDLADAFIHTFAIRGRPTAMPTGMFGRSLMAQHDFNPMR
jgi:hypothetical protein